jgi:DTW domain-containing protein YfiP
MTRAAFDPLDAPGAPGSHPDRPGHPSRRHRRPRCRVCGLHEEWCVCPILPRIDLPFEFLFVQHAVETARPTNTGRLAHHMLPNSRLIVYGRRGETADWSPLEEPGADYRLLYPRSSTRRLSAADWTARARPRLALVILDGTWHQAAHMAHRIAPLRGMPCVQLAEGLTSHWPIRHGRAPGQLCTAEAALRAVEALGHATAARAMAEAMALVAGRMLYMKGARPSAPTPEDARREVESWSIGPEARGGAPP